MRTFLLLLLALGATGCDLSWFEPEYTEPPDGAGAAGFNTPVFTFTNTEELRWINLPQLKFEEFQLNPALCGATGHENGGDATLEFDPDFKRFMSFEQTNDRLGYCVRIWTDDGLVNEVAPAQFVAQSGSVRATDHAIVGHGAGPTAYITTSSGNTVIQQCNYYYMIEGIAGLGCELGQNFFVQAPADGSQWEPSRSLWGTFGPALVSSDPDHGDLNLLWTPNANYAQIPSFFVTTIHLGGMDYTNYALGCKQPNGQNVECFGEQVAHGSVWVWDDGSQRMSLAWSGLNPSGLLHTKLVVLNTPGGAKNNADFSLVAQYEIPDITPDGLPRNVWFPNVAPTGDGHTVVWAANQQIIGGYVDAISGTWNVDTGEFHEHVAAKGSVSLAGVQSLGTLGERIGDYNACWSRPLGGANCLTHIPASATAYQAVISDGKPNS